MEKWLIITISAILLLIIYVLFVFIKLAKLRRKVEETFSILDDRMHTRWNEIPRFIETTKSYSDISKKTLEEIILLRNARYDSMCKYKKMNVDEEIGMRIDEILNELSINSSSNDDKSRLDLQIKFERLTKEIASARSRYEDCEYDYEKFKNGFPANILIKLFSICKNEK